MKDVHDYYSFICHRSEDKAFALKLQKRIERYKIPSKLGFPTKYVRHVFVDKNELRKPELRDELIEDIRKSDSLIVLCSPTSASPEDETADWSDVKDWKEPDRTGWIGFEISHFMDKNPDKPYGHIIPIVIDGDPVEGNCFHPLLLKEIRQQNLKWYDFREKKPYLDVIEAILNPLDHAEFRKRDKHRRVRRTVFATILSIFLLVAFVRGYDYFHPHVAEYQDYILVNETPVGIGKYEGNGEHYRITTNKVKKTKRLEHLNGQDTPIPEESEAHPDGPMIADYKLRDTGYPDTVEYLDRNGIVQTTYVYATDLAYVTFQENAFVSDQVYPVADENEYGVANRMNIDRYDLDKNERGMTKTVRFKHGENYVIDDNGVAGMQYEYEEGGRLTDITYLSITGEPCNNKNGISSIIYAYKDGYLSRKEYMNLDGELVYGENGYAKKQIAWKENERISTYFDPKGKPVLCNQWYAKAIEKFDDKGCCRSISYYGVDDEAVYCNGKYHKIERTYDNLGQIKTEAYYGVEDNLVLSRKGYAKEELEYDSYGNLCLRSTYDTDGQLMLMSNCAATEKRVYNKEGYLEKTSFFDVNGRPVLNNEGYHCEVRRYDKKNRLTELRYLGINEEGVYKHEDVCRYHAAILKYDKRGNVENVSLLTTEDRLIGLDGHWAKKVMTYSGGGQVETLMYTDQFGNFIDIAGNYAGLINEYDDRGLLKSTSYYNKTGFLTSNVQVINGVLVGDRFYAKVEFDYDDLGNAEETRYYDENNELTIKNIYAVEIAEHDELGRVFHRSFLDADRKPTKDYHTDMYIEYDEHNHPIKFQPMAYGERSPMFTDQTERVYGEERVFDERGNMTEKIYLESDGGIRQKKIMKYDDDGMLNAEMYYDGNDEPILSEDGYWKKSIGYDDRNNENHISYFDTDENPIMLADGYSQVVQEYNDNNVMVRKAFLDKDDKLVDCLSGFAYVEQKVTDRRSTSEAVFYDQNERELFSYHVEFNEYGQKKAEWLTGPDGAYLNHPSYGMAMTKYYYDDNRRKKREEYYDEEGNPANVYGITSGWESKYSDSGNELKRSNLGDNFDLAADDKGIVTAVFDYDELGREKGRIFLDKNGKESNCKFGFSRYQIKYGDDGEIEKTAYRDENGEEVTDLDGEVEKVVLSLHNGDHEIKETDVGTLVFVPVAYNVNRIAYHEANEYDMMLQFYLPFNVDYDVSKIVSAALKKYAEATDSDELDIKTVHDDGAEIESLLDKYLETIQEGGDFIELLGSIDIKNAMEILEPYVARMPTEKEFLDFYKEFYDNEIEKVRRQLQFEYGKDFILSYQIMDINVFSSNTIQSANAETKSNNLNMLIEDMINLEVKYTVKGNNKNDILSESFFYPKVKLFKYNDSWSFGRAEGFPSPDAKELRSLFGMD